MLNVLYDNNNYCSVTKKVSHFKFSSTEELRSTILYDQLPGEVSHVQRSGIFLRKEEKDCLVCLERTVQKRACTQCKNCEFECS